VIARVESLIGLTYCLRVSAAKPFETFTSAISLYGAATLKANGGACCVRIAILHLLGADDSKTEDKKSG
jgi:hypothetical protein